MFVVGPYKSKQNILTFFFRKFFTSIGNKGKSFIFLLVAFGYGTFICCLLDAHDTFFNVIQFKKYWTIGNVHVHNI